jgi:hypothetical protein
LPKTDRFVDLSEVRAHLEPYYSEVGRPSIDPKLMNHATDWYGVILVLMDVPDMYGTCVAGAHKKSCRD